MIDQPYFFELVLAFFGIIPFLRWIAVNLEKGGVARIEDYCRGSFDVTVILPMRNEECNARRKILEMASAISGKDNAFLIVINSASTDQTEKIAIEALMESGIDNGSWLYISADRPGKSIAINMALERVESEFIVMSDSDSIVSDGWLEKFESIFTESEVGIVSGVEATLEGNRDWRINYRKRANKIRIQESENGSTPILEGSIIGWRASITSGFRLDEGLNADDAQLTFRAIRMGFRAIVTEKISFSETNQRESVSISKSVRRSQGLSRVLLGNIDLVFSSKKGVPNWAIFHAVYLYVFFPWIFFLLISSVSIDVIFSGVEGPTGLLFSLLIATLVLSKDGRSILMGSLVSIISHCQFIAGVSYHAWEPNRPKLP